MKTIVTLIAFLGAPALASAQEETGGVEADGIEAAQVDVLPLPGPAYDAAYRRLSPPPSSDSRNARDVLLRLPVLPEAPGAAAFEPGRSAPPRRGEP